MSRTSWIKTSALSQMIFPGLRGTTGHCVGTGPADTGTGTGAGAAAVRAASGCRGLRASRSWRFLNGRPNEDSSGKLPFPCSPGLLHRVVQETLRKPFGTKVPSTKIREAYCGCLRHSFRPNFFTIETITCVGSQGVWMVVQEFVHQHPHAHVVGVCTNQLPSWWFGMVRG